MENRQWPQQSLHKMASECTLTSSTMDYHIFTLFPVTANTKPSLPGEFSIKTSGETGLKSSWKFTCGTVRSEREITI